MEFSAFYTVSVCVSWEWTLFVAAWWWWKDNKNSISLRCKGVSGGPEVFLSLLRASSDLMLSISNSCGVEYFRGGGKTRWVACKKKEPCFQTAGFMAYFLRKVECKDKQWPKIVLVCKHKMSILHAPPFERWIPQLAIGLLTVQFLKLHWILEKTFLPGQFWLVKKSRASTLGQLLTIYGPNRQSRNTNK